MCFEVCKWSLALCWMGILIVVGGYVGKGVYLHVNKGDHENTAQILADPEFYVPDTSFWVFGIVLAVSFFAVVGLIRLMVYGSCWCAKKLCCYCVGNCGSEEDLEQELKSLRKKRNKKKARTYKKISPDGSDDETEEE